MTEVVKTEKVLKINSVHDFFKYFQGSYEKGTNVEVAETIFGRILKGRKGFKEDFLSLTDCVTDRTAFCMESVSMGTLLFKSDTEILKEIGFTKPYVKEKIGNNFIFQFFVFEESKELTPIWGTWDGVLKMVELCFDKEIFEACKKFWKEISTKSVEEHQKSHKKTFFKIRANGKKDEDYLTVKRLLKLIEDKKVTAMHLRLWLYVEFGCRELFTGDGYTRLEDGTKGVKEYFIPNVLRKDLPKKSVVFHDMKNIKMSEW